MNSTTAKDRPDPGEVHDREARRASPDTKDLSQAKVLPPGSPVDVPNLPPKPEAGTRAKQDERPPVEDDATESSWADNTRPAPGKKNVRNSNIF